jgi:hypothetical protein
MTGLTPRAGARTVTCACGHREPLDPDRDYHTVPTGRFRYALDPATRALAVEREFAYICNPCWEALPDD